MTNQKHQITAFALALLVLISTTGISMKMMFCHCTGQEYWALITAKLGCCQEKEAQKAIESKMASCCSKKQEKHCQTKTTDSKKTAVEEKKCCTSKFQYAKANINLDLVQTHDLPVCAAIIPILSSYSFLPIWAEPFFVPQEIALAGCQNKAPPLPYGHDLLHWLQIYRC